MAPFNSENIYVNQSGIENKYTAGLLEVRKKLETNLLTQFEETPLDENGMIGKEVQSVLKANLPLEYGHADIHPFFWHIEEDKEDKEDKVITMYQLCTVMARDLRGYANGNKLMKLGYVACWPSDELLDEDSLLDVIRSLDMNADRYILGKGKVHSNYGPTYLLLLKLQAKAGSNAHRVFEQLKAIEESKKGNQ